MLLPAAHQFTHDALAGLRIIQPRIGDLPAILTQFLGKMAHGRENQRDLLGVVGHISALVHHLGHDHDIPGFIGLAQRRQSVAQLVAQHEDKTPYHGTRAPCQSKNCPLSSTVKSPITDNRFCAASSGGTDGCRPRYFSVNGVCTVPGCSATQIASRWLRPSSIAPLWIIWLSAALAVR